MPSQPESVRAGKPGRRYELAAKHPQRTQYLIHCSNVIAELLVKLSAKLGFRGIWCKGAECSRDDVPGICESKQAGERICPCCTAHTALSLINVSMPLHA